MRIDNKKIKKIWLQKDQELIHFRLKLDDEWDKFLGAADYVPFNYSTHRINYLFEYFLGNKFKIINFSSMIFYENEIVGIFPLSLTKNDTNYELTTFHLPILTPILKKNLSKKIKKKIYSCLILKIKEISKILKIKKIFFYEHFFNNTEGISDWHHELIINKSKIIVNYDYFLNLQENLDIIKTHFRKSYKNLINKGNKIWKIGILDKNNYNRSSKLFDEFKLLHLKVSGKKTRSDESWKIQKHSIKKNNRFMVYAKNKKNDHLVGAALFTYSKDEIDYEIAAYDRDLFHLPLGHPIQFRAIQKMKELKCKWYRVGELTNVANNKKINLKKLQIEKFEAGFSSNIFPKYLFELKI